MIDVEKLIEVPVAAPEIKPPKTIYRWFAYYWFSSSRGETYENIGYMASSPEEAARMANAGNTTVPGSVRVFEIPERAAGVGSEKPA